MERGKIISSVTQLLLLAAALTTGLAAPMAQAVTIHFYGDTYLPEHVLALTRSSAEKVRLASKLEDVLKAADHRVLNFEGVMTLSRLPLLVEKTYHLKMPLSVGPLLSKLKIDAVSLANNHAMDYGFLGLFDTMANLESEKIGYFGAGMNSDEAAQPLILNTAAGTVCLLGFNHTLPESTWAAVDQAGTYHPEFDEVRAKVSSCAQRYDFVVPVFHWGQEGTAELREYQTTLAHLSIDAGASAVVGHHPHVLQPVEWYRGKIIAYSLGNFLFGTKPFSGMQQGMVLELNISSRKIDSVSLIPLNVQNSEVNFVPTLIGNHESDPLESLVGTNSPCRQVTSASFRKWICNVDRMKR